MRILIEDSSSALAWFYPVQAATESAHRYLMRQCSRDRGAAVHFPSGSHWETALVRRAVTLTNKKSPCSLLHPPSLAPLSSRAGRPQKLAAVCSACYWLHGLKGRRSGSFMNVFFSRCPASSVAWIRFPSFLIFFPSGRVNALPHPPRLSCKPRGITNSGGHLERFNQRERAKRTVCLKRMFLLRWVYGKQNKGFHVYRHN